MTWPRPAADLYAAVGRSSFPGLAALPVDDLVDALHELRDLLNALKEEDLTKLSREWRPEVVRAATTAFDNLEAART